MLSFYKVKSLLTASSLALLMPCVSQAQYCTPSVSSGALYISLINFSSGFTGGVQYSTGNNSYSQTTGSSSGTVKPYFGASFNYGIINTTGSPKSYNLGIYVDWNNDNDFNDPGEEKHATNSTLVPANGSLSTGNTIIPPLNAIAGNHRVRMMVSLDGSANTACGPVSGEVEDYIFTVATNNAPVLNTSVNPIANTILSTQTNSNGISIGELVNSKYGSGAALITDADDRGTNYGNMVPRGIAITGLNATNGTLQYKIGTGSWTNVGAVSTSNALLLLADASYSNYQPGCRLRFVPTGTGTPNITIKAWDGTSGTSGDYANITATGGSTAFSTGNVTFVLPVVSNTGYNNRIYAGGTFNNVYTALYNATNNQFLNPEPILSNAADYYAVDVDADRANNKFFWIAGGNYDKIASADTNGANAQLSLISGLTYSTGLTVGNNKLYYLTFNSTYTNFYVKKSSETGTGISTVYTMTNVYDSKDIEYYNGKLYFQFNDDNGYELATVDTAGNNYAILYTSANYFTGLDIANDTIFWTEGGNIKKRPIGSASVSTVISGSGTFTDLIVDPVSNIVFYAALDSTSNDSYSLLKAATTSGSDLGTIATFTGAVYTLGFLDPSASPLPVTLISFNGSYNSLRDVANLQWETTDESAGERFTLERSEDGKQFQEITTINGKGNNDRSNQYQYEDDLQTIAGPAVFYRLKQIEQNGTYTYSKIVRLEKPVANTSLTVSPNPGNGIFDIRLSNSNNNKGILQVYNSLGKPVKTTTFTNSEFALDLSGNAAGIYYLQLNFDNGTQNQITVIKR